ncbi:MAG TPA: hypothetical protein V6D06_02165 [Trichocoleus sp.]
MGNRRTWLVGLAAAALLGVLLLGYGIDWLRPTGAAMAQTQPASGQSQPPAPASTPSLSGTYTDPQERFEVGILEAMTISSAGSSPLFQRPDGNLAYTVVVVPLAPGTADPLPDVALVRAAEDAFGAGEGFQTTGFQSVAGGGLQIGWTGRFSQGAAPAKPIMGTILAKQQGAEIFLLMVAGIDTGMEEVTSAIASLAPTLKVL